MGLVNLNRELDGKKITSAGKRKGSLKKKILITALILIFVFLAILIPARGVYAAIRQIQMGVGQANLGFKNENLDTVKAGIDQVKSGTSGLNTSLNFLIWVRIIPFVGGYYSDIAHFARAAEYEADAASIMVDYLMPFKSELGFNGVATPGQDRVAQTAKIFEKLIPNLDKVSPLLEKASKEVEGIDISKYPDTIFGRKLKSRVDVAKNFIVGSYIGVTKAKGAIEQIPSALGVPDSKRYLIIFQNDKELRPTGGFMTAYAFLDLNQGRLSSSSSDDIYRLDEQLLKTCENVICPLTPPDPIVRYLPEVNGTARKAWSMRDSNISPDVPTSIANFERMYSFLPNASKFDGIILIDTKVVEELIKITGPIEIFGNTYSADIDARCNCPKVIYELQNYAAVIEKGEQDRKAILGTLMQQILARSLGASSEKLPEFINAGVKLANNKDIIFYMKDPKLETSLRALGWTGEVNQSFVDYLMVNDANFAGGKSNLYVGQEVTYEIDLKSNPVKAKLTIKYANPYSYQTWLNGINRDYVRAYVPQGSKLTNSKGSEVKVTTIENELNRSVFEAFIQVRPQNSTTLQFEYELPANFGKDGVYPLMIQKQPGKKDAKYTIKINGQTKEQFTLTSDTELHMKI